MRSATPSGLSRGGLGESSLHVCVDMQRLFAEATDWHTPWMERVLPQVVRLRAHLPARTLFTRFIPAARAEEMTGTWRLYYEQWSSMTLDRLPPGMTDLMAPLARFVPPARIWDKQVYSPWVERDLHGSLQGRGIDTLVVSGGETDVCVLGTILGAVDRGYRVVVATDALCSSSDEAHDASVELYHRRYGQQVETATTAEILAGWAPNA